MRRRRQRPRGRLSGKAADRRGDRHVRTDPAWIDARGIDSRRPRLPGQHGHLPVSIATCWSTCSTKTDYHDFGHEIFPASIRTRRVQVHLFDGYWEDIGTIRSFYDANLALAEAESAVRVRLGDAPIYTRARFLPPTRLDGATIRAA